MIALDVFVIWALDLAVRDQDLVVSSDPCVEGPVSGGASYRRAAARGRRWSGYEPHRDDDHARTRISKDPLLERHECGSEGALLVRPRRGGSPAEAPRGSRRSRPATGAPTRPRGDRARPRRARSPCAGSRSRRMKADPLPGRDIGVVAHLDDARAFARLACRRAAAFRGRIEGYDPPRPPFDPATERSGRPRSPRAEAPLAAVTRRAGDGVGHLRPLLLLSVLLVGRSHSTSAAIWPLTNHVRRPRPVAARARCAVAGQAVSGEVVDPVGAFGRVVSGRAVPSHVVSREMRRSLSRSGSSSTRSPSGWSRSTSWIAPLRSARRHSLR